MKKHPNHGLLLKEEPVQTARSKEGISCIPMKTNEASGKESPPPGNAVDL